MTAGLETIAADEYIIGMLRADATLTARMTAAYTAYGEAVPATPEYYTDTITPDVTYPYILSQLHVPHNDTAVVNGTILFARLDYLVKVVDRNETYDTISAIYARVHQLLHMTAGTVADGVVYYSQRIRAFRYPEIDDAVQYRHLGGIYRLTVQS